MGTRKKNKIKRIVRFWRIYNRKKGTIYMYMKRNIIQYGIEIIIKKKTEKKNKKIHI